jgi:hypothetical protein
MLVFNTNAEAGGDTIPTGIDFITYPAILDQFFIHHVDIGPKTNTNPEIQILDISESLVKQSNFIKALSSNHAGGETQAITLEKEIVHPFKARPIFYLKYIQERETFIPNWEPILVNPLHFSKNSGDIGMLIHILDLERQLLGIPDIVGAKPGNIFTGSMTDTIIGCHAHALIYSMPE